MLPKCLTLREREFWIADKWGGFGDDSEGRWAKRLEWNFFSFSVFHFWHLTFWFFELLYGYYYILYIIYNNKAFRLIICGNADVKSEKVKKWKNCHFLKKNNCRFSCVIQEKFVPLQLSCKNDIRQRILRHSQRANFC